MEIKKKKKSSTPGIRELQHYYRSYEYWKDEGVLYEQHYVKQLNHLSEMDKLFERNKLSKFTKEEK